MAITSQGYNGEAYEIDEVGWAGISGSFGADYSLRGIDGAPDENAGRVTAVSSAERTVAIAPATFYGHGVRDRSDSTINVQLPVVAVGQTRWFLVAVRRDWQANATVVSAIPDPQTSAVIPSQRLKTPGVQDDQPLALVQVTGGQSIPTAVVDLRCWSGNAGLVAASTGALAYLDRLGSSVRIGGVHWGRAIGPQGSPEWSIAASRGSLLAVVGGTFFDNLAPSGAKGAPWVTWTGQEQIIGQAALPDPGVPYRVGIDIAGEWGSEDASTRFDFDARIDGLNIASQLSSGATPTAEWRQIIAGPSLAAFTGSQTLSFIGRRVFGTGFGSFNTGGSSRRFRIAQYAA